MSPIEMLRVIAVVVFLAAAAYSAARFAWSATRRATRAGVLAVDVPDLSHALMGLAMALMVSPAGPSIPEPLGIATFTVLAAWFTARLRHDGILGRAALPGVPCRRQCAGAAVRLGDLGHRDGTAAGHGGYHLHHLAGCAAMVVMYLTGHGAADAGAVAAAGAVPATATQAAIDAQSTVAAHGALGAHGAVPPLAALCWVFGLYFLVAATSLGFRVGEPAVQLSQHTATAATGRTSPAVEPPPAPAARLLTSPAGACATEVALSAGMAVLFFSAL